MATEIRLKKRTFFIPEPGDPCEIWKAYLKDLKKEISTNDAKTIWLVTWAKNGNSSCTTNADFNAFLKRNDIDVSSAATRAVADVSAIGGNILGLGKNLSKVVSVAVPIVLAGGLLVILIILFNTAKKKDVSDVAAFTPVGRAMKGIKALKA